MSDGLGSATYTFNNLSQMTSETRTFSGLTPTYTLSYEYNLAGELKSVTNPWSAQVSYGYDKAGRLSNVGGSGYAGVTNYASSLSYRAFGAIKGMSYGDGPNGQGHLLSTAYDNRLRPTKWDASNVLGYNYGYQGYYQISLVSPTVALSRDSEHCSLQPGKKLLALRQQLNLNRSLIDPITRSGFSLSKFEVLLLHEVKLTIPMGSVGWFAEATAGPPVDCRAQAFFEADLRVV